MCVCVCAQVHAYEQLIIPQPEKDSRGLTDMCDSSQEEAVNLQGKSIVFTQSMTLEPVLGGGDH